ncbi:MAG: T9SS C-terminal target domain-containing protein, partial [Bacteroidetes bacterium]
IINRPDRGCFGETVEFSVDNAPGSVSWNFNGPVTTNTTVGRRVQVTFVGAGPLSFSVTIATDDCTGVFRDQIMVASCVQTPGEGEQAVNTATIYPNPVPRRTVLDFGEELLAPATVVVYNMNQNQIASYPVAAYTRRLELSLEDQPAGVYLVQIIQPGQPLHTLRMLKL